jgi:dipeptidyl aminopeptidase/acylaminoacyl peptidase
MIAPVPLIDAVLVQLTSLAAVLLLEGGPPPGDAAKPVAPQIHPTLEEIYKPPRLLGARPTSPSISASGRLALWRCAAHDTEKPKLDWWLAPTSGEEEARVLFPASAEVQATWGPSGDELFVVRNGWIERIDLAGDQIARPLFECGSNVSRLTFTRDGAHLVFVAGEEAELWVVDLESGARRAPAHRLALRDHWFQVLEEADQVALFAAPPEPKEGDAPVKNELPPPPLGNEPPITDRKEGATTAEPRVKRVLWLVPLLGEGEPRATKLRAGDPIEISADAHFACRRHLDEEAKRQLVVADFLTEAVTTVRVRDSLAGDPAAKMSLELYDLERDEAFPPPVDEGRRYFMLDTEWSPTGSLLLVHRLSGDFHSRQLLVVDPQARRSWPLFSERDDAWIGGPMLLCAWRRDGSEVLFSSEQSGFCHLYAVAASGGEVRTLTSGPFEDLRARLLEDGEHALVLENDPDPAEKRLFLLELASGAKRRLDAPRGCTGDFVTNAGGSQVVFLHEQLGTPNAVATDEGAEAVRLSDTVPAEYRRLKLPDPEIVEYQNPDDQQRVRAFLYKPEPFDPNRRYPAVVFVHGAGYLQNVTRSMSEYAVNMLFHHRLARMGFVVLDADYRHSAGYGRKFRTDVYGFMGGKDLDDEVAGVHYLDSLGFVDTSRVGLYGGSYGGFLTLMALFTKPDTFACGAALRSVTDWRTYNAWYTNARLGDPKKDADNYKRSSPIDHAEGLKRPLLLLHGLKDSNVFAQDTIRLIEKLIHLGKDFEVMLYPSQDHGFTDPESWIDEYKRIERLFVRELKPTPPARAAVPDNPTAPKPRPI